MYRRKEGPRRVKYIATAAAAAATATAADAAAAGNGEVGGVTGVADWRTPLPPRPPP